MLAPITERRMAFWPERRYESLDGVRFCLAEVGEGAPLVLLAGWPQSLHAWRHVVPRLAPHYRVIAIDPPGLGDSDLLPGPHDTDSVAKWLRRLLDQLGLGPVRLAAHDIGTWIAYPLAALFPDSVRAMVVMDAAVPGIAPAEAYALTPDRVRKSWHFAFNAMPEVPEMLLEGRERRFLEWLFRDRSVNPAAFDPADVDEYVRLYARPGRMRAGLAYYRAIFANIARNREHARTKLRLPVPAIGGAQWLGETMRASFELVAEHVTSVSIENCGHFVPEEAPERAAELILDFFAREA
jgi:microsomal epoxide hydrolase